MTQVPVSDYTRTLLGFEPILADVYGLITCLQCTFCCNFLDSLVLAQKLIISFIFLFPRPFTESSISSRYHKQYCNTCLLYTSPSPRD